MLSALVGSIRALIFSSPTLISPIMSSISINLQAVRQQIVQAAQLADRSFTEIQLLAVSKNFDAATVL